MNKYIRQVLISTLFLASLLFMPLSGQAQIVIPDCDPGFERDPAGECVEIPTGTIPEPSILALFGLGIAGLVFIRRRKLK